MAACDARVASYCVVFSFGYFIDYPILVYNHTCFHGLLVIFTLSLFDLANFFSFAEDLQVTNTHERAVPASSQSPMRSVRNGLWAFFGIASRDATQPYRLRFVILILEETGFKTCHGNIVIT